MTHINSVDATTGQPMIARVLQRKAELEARRETLREDDLQTRSDIDLALNTIGELITGDLAHIPQVVVVDMSKWLERSKHIAEIAVDDDEDVQSLPPVDDAPAEHQFDGCR